MAEQDHPNEEISITNGNNPQKSRVVTVTDVEQLIVENSNSLYAYLYRILGNVEDAQDAVQETALSMYRHAQAGRFITDRPQSGMVFIGRNKAYDQLRTRGKMQIDSLDARKEQDPTFDLASPDNLEKQVIDGGFGEPMRRALRATREQFRLALILHYIEGYSKQDLAQALGIAEKDVNHFLYRARQQLLDRYNTIKNELDDEEKES